MPERLTFDVGSGRSGRRRDEDEPMRLLVIGDFTGAPPANRTTLDGRRSYRVDVDNLDQVIGRLQPRVTLPVGEIGFERIDDFHPDRLYARVGAFETLRQSRATPSAPADDVLGRLLGKARESAASPVSAPPTGIDALIHDIVAPHIVKETSAQTSLHLATVDAAIAEQMREVLHDPTFQSLEAAWRGVHWLVASLELDEQLQLHVFDVSRDELLADIAAAEGQVAKTALHRTIVERSTGQSWSAVIVLLPFGPSATDVGLLAALGLLAARAGAPLLAGADGALLGAATAPAGEWEALRHSEVARFIALATPRVLLRSPHGKASDPIDAFAFEELDGARAHEQLLWGNPALAVAVLLGRAFGASGWNMQPGDEREIDDLPAYTFVRDGEREMQPCAERFLTEREIDVLIQTGLTPVVSRRDRHGVVVPRLQSIAEPPAALAW